MFMGKLPLTQSISRLDAAKRLAIC